MNRTAAIDAIRQCRPQLEQMGVLGAYLFGSTARDEQDGLSDIDLAIDINTDSAAQFSMLDISRIGLLVEDATGVYTDVVVRDDLKQLKTNFDADAVRIF